MMRRSSSSARLLDPLDSPITLLPGYTRDDQITLVFTEKVFNTSEETFDVTDETGTPVLRATGKPLHMKNIKRITDVNGSTILKITASVQGTLQRAFTATSEDGTELFRADKKWSWGAKLEVNFTDATSNEPVKLFVKGYGTMSKAEVTLEGGQVIAIFRREFWGKGLLNNSKSASAKKHRDWDWWAYHLTIAAGVDLALMTALCIIFDECKFDDAKKS